MPSTNAAQSDHLLGMGHRWLAMSPFKVGERFSPLTGGSSQAKALTLQLVGLARYFSAYFGAY